MNLSRNLLEFEYEKEIINSIVESCQLANWVNTFYVVAYQ